MENLIAKTTKIGDIPHKIQEILYEYIRERGYFPKDYLTTFQVNRLDFEFFGGMRNVTVPRAGMVLAYLIICGVFVQQILLHIRDVFTEFKKYKSIETSALYIGSIIHYLTRDTFIHGPRVVKTCLGLFNYYRNYHSYNEYIEKQKDSFKGALELQGTENDDEYGEFLVPENDISDFWKFNSAFVDTYKKFIYGWAVKLAKLIMLKFGKGDPNLLPRKRMPRPQKKTVVIDSSDEEDEEDKKIKELKKKRNEI